MMLVVMHEPRTRSRTTTLCAAAFCFSWLPERTGQDLEQSFTRASLLRETNLVDVLHLHPFAWPLPSLYGPGLWRISVRCLRPSVVRKLMMYCTARRAWVFKICVSLLFFDTTSLPASSTELENLSALVLSDSLKLDLQYAKQPIGALQLTESVSYCYRHVQRTQLVKILTAIDQRRSRKTAVVQERAEFIDLGLQRRRLEVTSATIAGRALST